MVPTTAEVKSTTAPENSPQGSNNSPSATAVTVKTTSGNTPQGNHKAPTPAVSTSLVITTEVVTEYTTYCPFPTTFSTNGVTYSVTKATTLTVTGPCTVTRTNTVVVPTSAEETGAVTKAPNAPQGNGSPTVVVTAGGNSQQGGNSPSWAGPTTVTITDVVSTLTTYCPGYTTFSTNGVSYTVTEPTTLTITDCPCTVTRTSVLTQHKNTQTVTAGPYFPISSRFSSSNDTIATRHYNQTGTLAPTPSKNATLPTSGTTYGSAPEVVSSVSQNNTAIPSTTQLKARAYSDSSDEYSTNPSVKSLTNAASRLFASPFLIFAGLLTLW